MRTDTLFRENTARMAKLSMQLEHCAQRAFLAEGLAKKLGWGLSLLGLVFLALVFIRFKT